MKEKKYLTEGIPIVLANRYILSAVVAWRQGPLGTSKDSQDERIPPTALLISQ